MKLLLLLLLPGVCITCAVFAQPHTLELHNSLGVRISVTRMIATPQRRLSCWTEQRTHERPRFCFPSIVTARRAESEVVPSNTDSVVRCCLICRPAEID